MLHNQHDFVNNLKPKRDSFLKANKTLNGSIHMTKMRNDRTVKSKSERIIPTPTPIRFRKPHNCLPETLPICEKQEPYITRKSISMVELPCQVKVTGPKRTPSKEHGDEKKIQLILKHSNFIPYLKREEYDIARKAYKMFILHAWRRRRAQVSALQNTTQKLEHEVQNFNIQIVVLRNLLESEKLRVAVALSDSSHLKGRLENELNTISELKKNFTELEQQKLKLEKTQEDMQMKINSLNSELEIAREVIKTLQEGNSQARKEMTNSKQREDQLTTKLGVTESQLRDKTNCLNELKKSIVDFKVQIAELVEKNNVLCKEGEIREKEMLIAKKIIVKKENELNIFRNIRKAQDENIVNLNHDLTVAKNKTTEQEERIVLLENIINTFRAEKEKYEQNLLSLRNQAIFRAIKIFASLFVPGQHLASV